MTNPFFNQFTDINEQSLIDSLVQEAIQIYGIDIVYLPKDYNNEDKIYGEDNLSTFTSAYTITMYIKNVEGFGGQGDFLSKFNLQIRDTVTFTVSKTLFGNTIGQAIGLFRPREGDLCYLSLNKKFFQIKFLEQEPVFYQFGSMQMYDLKCELFDYSGEVFATGNTIIDTIANTQFQQLQSNNMTFDAFSDNSALITEANTYIDFSESDPWSENQY